MNRKTRVLDVRQYAAQYELLRAQVTGTPRDGALGREACQQRGVGLALLLREGLPGWLTAVEVLLCGSLAAPAPKPALAGTAGIGGGCGVFLPRALPRPHDTAGEPGALDSSSARLITTRRRVLTMSMNGESHQKITTEHLSRVAYLYVRQSTLRQVVENTESTQRQYALASARSNWGGHSIASWSSTAIWGSRGRAPPIARASSNW